MYQLHVPYLHLPTGWCFLRRKHLYGGVIPHYVWTSNNDVAELRLGFLYNDVTVFVTHNLPILGTKSTNESEQHSSIETCLSWQDDESRRPFSIHIIMLYTILQHIMSTRKYWNSTTNGEAKSLTHRCFLPYYCQINSCVKCSRMLHYNFQMFERRNGYQLIAKPQLKAAVGSLLFC